MNNRVICRACNSNNIVGNEMSISPFVADRMFDGKNFSKVYECLDCNLLWLNVEPTDKQLSKYYDDYWGQTYIAHRESYEPGLRERHSHLLKPRGLSKLVEDLVLEYLNPKNILDIGGGTGIETAFRLQKPIDIFEVAEMPVSDGCVRVDKISKKYDLVILSHVLEHVPSPQSLLSFAISACSDNSLVYIEIPDEANNYGSPPRLNNVLEKRKYWHEHLQFYDDRSINALIESCGGQIVKIKHIDWAGGSIIQVLAYPNNKKYIS